MSDLNRLYTIGDSVKRAALTTRYRRETGDPTHRPLQIYSTDPADSKLHGSRVQVDVPYEPLQPGPTGSLFEIRGGLGQPSLDLNDLPTLITGGLKPAPTTAFQSQMVYAVAMTTYEAFRKALGRDPHWGFGTPETHSAPSRLKLYPCAEEMQNAYYDRHTESVRFGWFMSGENSISGRHLRRGKVFTSLSHDIVAHEIAHALLDGLRPNFMRPYHHDTLALHEAFADLVAIFQHFSHRDLLKVAISATRGNIESSHLLTDIARQFGQTMSNPGYALRTAVDFEVGDRTTDTGKNMPSSESTQRPQPYDPNLPIHELGSVLVSAVFSAFTTIFDRKTRKYIKIATGGSGVLPDGDLETSLADVLAKQAADLAQQFLSICIRAIDYCPPVAVTFGDYLRAMITADFDLVPDDPYGYREALVDAFVARDIPIEAVETLGESSLLWTHRDVSVDRKLLKNLQPEHDEFRALRIDASEKYIDRARRIGDYLTTLGTYHRLGLINPADHSDRYRNLTIPCIESARVSRRISPDGGLETDLVVEITQNLDVMFQGYPFPAIQGCTLIIDLRGKIRYVIQKDALDYIDRLTRSSHTNDFAANGFWINDAQSGRWSDQGATLKAIHQKNTWPRTI